MSLTSCGCGFGRREGAGGRGLSPFECVVEAGQGTLDRFFFNLLILPLNNHLTNQASRHEQDSKEHLYVGSRLPPLTSPRRTGREKRNFAVFLFWRGHISLPLGPPTSLVSPGVTRHGADHGDGDGVGAGTRGCGPVDVGGDVRRGRGRVHDLPRRRPGVRFVQALRAQRVLRLRREHARQEHLQGASVGRCRSKLAALSSSSSSSCVLAPNPASSRRAGLFLKTPSIPCKTLQQNRPTRASSAHSAAPTSTATSRCAGERDREKRRWSFDPAF